ncbi:MAG TPA: ATP-binding protein [Acidimicrobiales bacterium]|nr:ATP-binding protein [Acidimicrobiales bacterium]
MKWDVWRPSPLTVAVTLVVAAATVLGFVLTDRSVASQNQALLKSDTTQAAEYVSSIVSSVGAPLQALASGVTLTNGSPAEFAVQAKSVAQTPASVILARKTGAGFVVTAVAGAGFVVGRSPGPSVDATLERATADLTPGPVRYDGKSTTFGFAVGPPLVPAGTAIFEQLRIDPFVAITATQGAPFHVLRAAVYASHGLRGDQLVLANTHALPLVGPTAEASVAVGSSRWWLVAEARSPLAGGFPNAAPLILLGVGLLLALAIGSTVEALVRRHRYATDLVAERTAELDASHAALLRSERLSALGEMASTIGHELRNPLAAVINAHFMVRHTLGDTITPELDGLLVMAERQTTRAATLADNLTAFVRQREPDPVPVDLGEVVNEVLEATPLPPGIDVSVDVPPLVVQADSDQITQVFANLIVNGFQAMPDGGTLRIQASADDGCVVITVSDSGAGVDSTVLERVFDPFFTTKASGTGLGLAIVARIVEAHGGEVSLRNGEAGGAVVTVRLPVAPASQLARR